MGTLHAGHLSLIQQARRIVGRKGLVVVSVFVNPTQFNQKWDFKKYSRQLVTDVFLCRNANVDLVFAPSEKTMYPSHFSTWVEEIAFSLPLCGARRPGHFRGVCTIVFKLFNLVQPAVAIFGQKDAQQALVIRRMVRDLNIPVRIIVVPTVREKDGLAMSSRNQRLSISERAQAVALYENLQLMRQAFRNGIRNASILKNLARDRLQKVPKLCLDYLEIVHPSNLQPASPRCSRGDLIAIAAFLGKTRLIDNIRL